MWVQRNVESRREDKVSWEWGEREVPFLSFLAPFIFSNIILISFNSCRNSTKSTKSGRCSRFSRRPLLLHRGVYRQQALEFTPFVYAQSYFRENICSQNSTNTAHASIGIFSHMNEYLISIWPTPFGLTKHRFLIVSTQLFFVLFACRKVTQKWDCFRSHCKRTKECARGYKCKKRRGKNQCPQQLECGKKKRTVIRCR